MIRLNTKPSFYFGVAFLLLSVSTVGWAQVLEEIIVTAQKREQNLQEVGISLTALTGQDLKGYGLNRASELAYKVPNLQIYLPYGPGSSGNIVLRGIGVNDFGEGHEAPVTLYVDEFYLPAVPAVDFSMFDVNRVEVLRGPQGTLFGRNATGGLVHFVTAKPTFERDGFISLGGGRFGEIKAEGGIGGALTDKVAGRISFLSHHSDGYIKNLNPDFKDGGQAGTDGVRAQLLFEPGNNWSITLKAEYTDISARHMYYGQLPMMIDPVTGAGIQNPDPTATDSAGFSLRNFGITKLNAGIAFTDEPQRLNQDGFSFLARIEKEIGDITLTSLTGYLDLERKLVEDCDASPNPICFADFPYKSDWITQELRASGATGALSWTVGGFYMHQDASNDPTATFNFPVSGPAATDPVTGLYNGFVFPIALAAHWEQSVESYSAFSQLEYEFSDRVTLIGGVRVGRDTKDFFDRDNSILRTPGSSFLPPLGIGVANPYQADYGETLVSWRIQLDYQASESILFFASVSESTKAGGFNNGFLSGAAAADQSQIPYDSESNLAFEAGEKAILLDGRLRINGAVFYYDYTDYQIRNWFGIGNLVSNQDATAYGGEIEVDWLMTENFEVEVAAGFVETNIKDVVGPNPAYVADRNMAMAPRVTANGALKYKVPLNENYPLTLQWDWNYLADRYSVNFDEQAGVLQDEFKHNAYATVGIGEHWTLAAYIKNISDKKTLYRYGSSPALGLVQQVFASPRTYGATLTYSF